MPQPPARASRKHSWVTSVGEQVYLAAPDLTGSYPDTLSFIAAQWPDESCFLFSRKNLQAECRRFLKGFRGSVAFAVKANPSAEVIATMIAVGIEAFDVASIPEILLVRRHSASAELRYNNPVKTRREIARAIHHYGVTHLTVDDERELDKVLAIAGRARIEIAVRLQVDRRAGYHDFRSKFGAPLDVAARLLKRIAKEGHQPAICFHPGSQCLDPGAYVELIEDAAQVASEAGVMPSALNVGGGFPVSYSQGETVALEAFFRAIEAAFDRHFDKDHVRLLCEPGRALVATSMSLLMPVRHRRPSGEVFLGDGLYGALQELFIAPIRFPYRVLRQGKVMCGESAAVKVFGPTCDPTDVLPEPMLLPPDIDEGDHLELGLIGGYGPSTVSRFNGFGTSEIVEVEDIFVGGQDADAPHLVGGGESGSH